ncbi:sunset domain-containing protein [Tessaracoccus sp. Y36]
MRRSQELKKAAAETASAAAVYSTAALKEGLDRAQLMLADLQKQAAPVLHDAKIRTADYAAKRLDDFEPHLKDAMSKVAPAIEIARERVEDDLLPKVQDFLHQAAELPVVIEGGKRGKAALKALKGELEPAPKKSGWRTFGKVLAIGAIVAGAAAAVRHFLSPKDDGWTAHEPSKAYVNNNDTFSNAAKFASDTVEPTDEVAEPAEDEVQAQDVTTETTPPASVVEDAAAPGTAAAGYGDGSYVGTEPPAGFTIKGNERSKKYHVEGSGGYDRTIAEVWFNSEEAAEAAGFTRAQR